MARTSIKSTYALDVETVRMLERIAQQWRVSKSEALRRAIRSAAREHDATGVEGVHALDELQESARLSPTDARRWAQAVRTERRSLPRGEPRDG